MTHKFTQFLTLGAILAVSSVLPLSAVTLESLETGGSLTVGNVNYFNFNWVANCSVGGAACTAGEVSGIDPTTIDVTAAVGLPAGEQGFEITSPIEVISNGQNVQLDVTLTYDAEVVGSSAMINDVYLAGADSFNPVSGGIPGPSISIGETVTDLTTSAFLGKLEIQDPPADLSDKINLNPATTGIMVTKDIQLDSGAGSSQGFPDYANLTTLIQATSLTATPEPRAYALLLVGFFGAFVAIQRRRRQTA